MHRNPIVEKYGSGDIIRKRILAELSFLKETLRIDLFYNPTKYIIIFLIVVELCSGNQNEEKIWIRGHN